MILRTEGDADMCKGAYTPSALQRFPCKKVCDEPKVCADKFCAVNGNRFSFRKSAQKVYKHLNVVMMPHKTVNEHSNRNTTSNFQVDTQIIPMLVITRKKNYSMLWRGTGSE